MLTIPLKCQCGTVQGSVQLASSKTGNHVVCYCTDCQAFANHLPDTSDILDEWGGTAVYQVAPWTVSFDQGADQLRCLRLTPKGLYRWYTACCQTPVGNTVSVKFPFVGLIHSFLDEGGETGTLIGPIRGYHKVESAMGDIPQHIKDKGMPLSTFVRLLWRLLKWKVTAGGKHNPFYRADGKSVSRPKILKPLTGE